MTTVSKLSDYLQLERDEVAEITFHAAGDDWCMQALTGAAAEAIEAAQQAQAITGAQARLHWMIGGMAAQLHRLGEEVPDPLADEAQYAIWLKQRMATFSALASSDFEAIYRQYVQAMEQSTQLFQIWFDEHGIIVLPNLANTADKVQGGVVSNIPPARFRVLACLSDITLAVFGKPA
mgnify:FL=1